MGYFKKVGLATAVGLGVLGLVFIVAGLAVPILRFGFLLTGGLLLVFAVFSFFIGKVTGDLAGEGLLADGVPASAIVTAVAETGTVINYTNAVLAIGLRVQPGDSPQPYDITIKQAVPITAMARVQPGAAVVVRVDPKDRTKAVIDWSASTYLGANAVPGQAQPMPGMPGVPGAPGAAPGSGWPGSPAS
ncbi:MAG: hypothetical protein R2726_19690 [Acidimicrobiales bacterium]